MSESSTLVHDPVASMAPALFGVEIIKFAIVLKQFGEVSHLATEATLVHPTLPNFQKSAHSLASDLLVYFKKGHAFKDEINNSIDPTSSIQFFRSDSIQCHEPGDSGGRHFFPDGVGKLHML